MECPNRAAPSPRHLRRARRSTCRARPRARPAAGGGTGAGRDLARHRGGRGDGAGRHAGDVLRVGQPVRRIGGAAGVVAHRPRPRAPHRAVAVAVRRGGVAPDGARRPGRWHLARLVAPAGVARPVHRSRRVRVGGRLAVVAALVPAHPAVDPAAGAGPGVAGAAGARGPARRRRRRRRRPRMGRPGPRVAPGRRPPPGLAGRRRRAVRPVLRLRHVDPLAGREPIGEPAAVGRRRAGQRRGCGCGVGGTPASCRRRQRFPRGPPRGGGDPVVRGARRRRAHRPAGRAPVAAARCRPPRSPFAHRLPVAHRRHRRGPLAAGPPRRAR